jgi:hypothetical protein
LHIRAMRPTNNEVPQAGILSTTVLIIVSLRP